MMFEAARVEIFVALFYLKGSIFMGTKNIADLKEKIVNAIDEIDTSKLTLCDLKLLTDTVSVLANINDKPFDVMDAYAKLVATGFGAKQTTLSELKEGE